MVKDARKVVRNVRLSDQVYSIIRDELTVGELKPGQKLYEDQLAVKYGVSRTPVREALFQLAREGVLIGGRRSFRLPVDTVEDLRHRIEVHILLDPALARHAAAQGTDVQVRALARAHAASEKAHQVGDVAAFAKARHQFHRLEREMCRNVALVRCCAALEDKFLSARNDLFRRSDNRAIVLRHHGRILKAIKARDPGGAEREAREYATALAERFADATYYGQVESTGVNVRTRKRAGSLKAAA